VVTIEIALTEEQAWRLLDHAQRKQQTVSGYVVAADERVAEWEAEERRVRAERAKAVAGTGESGAPDLVERHDDYFAETLTGEMSRWNAPTENSQGETDTNEAGID
jgi:hypothetical protein